MPHYKEPESVRVARLLASSPEAVFEDLRTAAEVPRYRLTTELDEELETALSLRHEHLIDLALAQFGRSRAVVAPLLTEGLGKPSSPSDAARRCGLRVACYANTQLDSFLGLSDGLLHKLVPERTKARVLANADLGEMGVLLRNPAVGDTALADLYRKSGPFEKLSEERWCRLVQCAADNPRIVAAGDEEHGPDWGFWEIHKALFELVTTAPVTDNWCRALHWTLARVHPPGVEITAPINETLNRWADFEAKDYKGEVAGGIYTDLPLAEEFRCIVAAVYGTRLVDSNYERAGTPGSKTLAERCAYYGGASLTEKEVAKFATRDGAAFALAFTFNGSAMCSSKSREAFEKHVTFWPDTYRARLEVLARKWKYLRTVIARWDNDDDETEDPVSASFARVEKDIAALAKEVRRQGWLLGAGFILLCLLLGR
jgi:hypothetical protein